MNMIDQKHRKECCLGSDCVEMPSNKQLFLCGVVFGLAVAVIVVAFYSVV
jgi:hypothetical protein